MTLTCGSGRIHACMKWYRYRNRIESNSIWVGSRGVRDHVGYGGREHGLRLEGKPGEGRLAGLEIPEWLAYEALGLRLRI